LRGSFRVWKDPKSNISGVRSSTADLQFEPQAASPPARTSDRKAVPVVFFTASVTFGGRIILRASANG